MNGPTYQELLSDCLGRKFAEQDVIAILSQVLPQLIRLHQQGLAHGGISPATLVQDADTQYTHLTAAQPLTDASYLAPECLQTGQATPTGDVYGLGVTMLALLTGQSPSVLQPSPGIWNWRNYSAVSNPLAALLDQTIAFHPQLRYADAMQMFQALQAVKTAIKATDSSPTAEPPVSTTPQTLPASSTVPVAVPMADSRQFPWPWVALGIGSLLVLSLIGFASTRFLQPIRNPEVIASPAEPDPDPERSPEPEPPVSPEVSSESGSSNPFIQETFPKATCGDAMPADLADFPVEFHPVFVPNRGRNLRRIRTQFCQDALSVTRKDTAEKAIQVASFISSERAEAFQQFLNDEFRDAEVGQSTVYDRPVSEAEPPEQAQPEAESPAQPAPETNPEINTDRISFAAGETGTSLRGEVSENQLQRYLINCGEAQQFILRIENGDIKAVVISPDGATLGAIGEAGSQWQGTLPSTGDYTLEVMPLERNSDYRISIEVL